MSHGQIREDRIYIGLDIDFAGPTAQEGDLKTRASERYVPVSSELKGLLLAKKGHADDLVEWRDVKPKLTSHYFRHNYVTLLYESGVDLLIAMKIVGRSSYHTTVNLRTIFLPTHSPPVFPQRSSVRSRLTRRSISFSLSFDERAFEVRTNRWQEIHPITVS